MFLFIQATKQENKQIKDIQQVTVSVRNNNNNITGIIQE